MTEEEALVWLQIVQPVVVSSGGEKAATTWLLLSIVFFVVVFSPLPPNTAICFSFKRGNPSRNLQENTVFTFWLRLTLEVSHIKLDNSSIFLKSVLKLYFKHFYLKLLNSCLYGKKKNLCPGILKCVCV